jgi:23S rRNA (cytidine1920-2'-O)/16S rRNA (cytidine1409-2'-O)-methyltransferase
VTQDKNKIRLDTALRQWGIAPSRAKAQELLREGAVEIFDGQKWSVCMDESRPIESADPAQVRLRSTEVIDYVSRGGRKLEAALKDLQIEVQGLRVLDVGLSTGGFSDCLLRHAVREIVGVDVGHDQLAEKLKSEPRLKAFEGINARQLRTEPRLQEIWQEPFDLAVIDVSFISLEVILPEVALCLPKGGRLIALVKPQFEVANKDHNRRGVVTDLELHAQVRDKVKRLCLDLGFDKIRDVPCRITGQDGNQEYFLYAEKS